MRRRGLALLLLSVLPALLLALGFAGFLALTAAGPDEPERPTDGIAVLTLLEAPVREISELIKAQRGYELNAKVITAADQMMGATVQVR